MEPGYRALLVSASARKMFAALSAAWLSFGMLSLAVFLTVQRATGSSARAGVVVGLFSVGSGALAPVRGRLIDRRGAPVWLPAFAAGYGIALVLLVVVAAIGGSGWLLAICAVGAGLSAPPLVATLRDLWSSVIQPPLLRRAYALTSLVSDLGLVIAPAVGGLLFAIVWWSPLAVCVATGLAAAAIAAQLARASHPQPTTPSEVTGAVGVATGLRMLLAVSVALGLVLGLVEVAVPAAATRWQAATYSGFLLAAFALGSILGGVWFGTRNWQRPPEDRYLYATLVLALMILPAASATGPATLAPLLILAGLAYGPGTISLFEALDSTDWARSVEAFTWITTAEASGTAAGASLSGWATDQVGTWAPFAAASLVLGTTTIAALALRKRACPDRPHEVA